MAIMLSETDRKYLDALKKARLAIITGAQSYRIGSRAVTRADIKFINDEIARLEGSNAIRVRRVIPVDI